jgi:hypothetical protein
VAALRGWAASAPEVGTEAPFTPRGGAADSDVVRILVALADAWIAAEAGGRTALPWALSYGIDDLDARILLRLGPEGRLAASREDDPLHLALDARVGRRASMVVATAFLRPPDFLAAGSLHEAFGTLVRSEAVVPALQAALADAEASVDVVRAFVASPAASWVALRVARRATHDTDVILWQSDWNGRRRLLVLRVDVVVDAGGAEPTVRLADDPRLRARMVWPDAERLDVLEDEASYFARLLREILRWKRLAA